MSNNLVIVAIPDQNDRVWKVSSEKVPHLTLLFLGDEAQVQNLDVITQFVEHAVNIGGIRRFYLPVERRGELGDDPETGPADVLFFRQRGYDFKAIRDFREQLLQEPNIKTAFDSADQYDTWTPHLTMGYQSTPAKPDNSDYPSFYDVTFDRIAVWTGDYAGPEFVLKDYWDDMDVEGIAGPLAMSTLSANDARVAAGMEALEHYGVKGMRWGVRKQEVGSGGHILINERTGRAAVSSMSQVALVGGFMTVGPFAAALFLHPRVRAEFKAAQATNKGVIADKKWKKAISKSKKAVEVHNKAADEINSKLEAFNNDKRWKGVDLTKDPVKQAEYNRAAERELLNPAYSRAAVAVHGTSPSGRYKFEIQDAATATLKITDLHLQHAAADAPLADEVTINFKIIRDPEGHILGFDMQDPEADSLAQAVERGAEFLEHYGVKGMRWGVRKEDVSGAVRSGARKVGGAAKRVGKGIYRVGSDTYFESEAAREEARKGVVDRASSTWAQRDLTRLNKKYEGTKAAKIRTRLVNPLDANVRAYREESKIKLRDRINEEIAKLPSNASGTRRYEIDDNGATNTTANWTLRAVDVKKNIRDVKRPVAHAATADPKLNVDLLFQDGDVLEPVMDSDGYFTGEVKLLGNAAQHTADLGAEFLAHYGVKGMRWGVRKEQPVTTSVHVDTGVRRRQTQVRAEGGVSHPAHHDAVKAAVAKQIIKKSGTDALSTQDLRDLANRLQVEGQVHVLMSSKGKQFVSKQLENEGKQALTRGAKSVGRRAAPHVVRRAAKGAATVATTAALA